MRYIISAGGTGGHIYPAIAIINKIKEMDKKAAFLYIGTVDRMEKDIIPSLGIAYNGIKIRGLSKNIFKSIEAVYDTLSGIRKCKKIIRNFKPDIVIGVGGYVTVPVIYAAHALGIKTLLHEQNSVVGKANTFLSKYSDTICVSMKNSMTYFKNCNVIYTGNPRSEEAIKAKKINKKELGFDDKKLVLITTGSLGAKTVNDVILESLKEISKKDYNVLFVTGKSSYDLFSDMKSDNLKVVPYLDNMTSVMKAADLIISRAGATTICEITSIGIPSILIPSPYVANNHQYYNAYELSSSKAAILIEEKNLTTKTLLDNIDNIFNDKKLYDSLKNNTLKLGVSDSASRIYNEIEKLIK